MKYILHFFITAEIIFLLANYVMTDSIILNGGYVSALIFSVVLAFVNLFLGGFLRIVGFPLNFVTLGLFSIVIAFIVIWVTTKLYSGIEVHGFFSYLVMAFVPAIGSVVTEVIIPTRGKKR